MTEWFDINGTAMIYIRDSKAIRDSKTTKEANHRINTECKNVITVFKNILQGFTKQNPEIFHLRVFIHWAWTFVASKIMLMDQVLVWIILKMGNKSSFTIAQH